MKNRIKTGKIILAAILFQLVAGYHANGQIREIAPELTVTSVRDFDQAKEYNAQEAIYTMETESTITDFHAGYGATQDDLRDVPWFVSRFKVSAGWFYPNSNTLIRLGRDGGNSGEVDFEDDLGFKVSTNTFLGNFQYRLSSRSRFDLSIYSIQRTSTKVLDRTIEFGDNTYEINSEVTAFFDTNIYRFSYGYAIFSKPTFEIGMLVGAHIINASAGISLIGKNIDAGVSDDFDVTAPLPDLGIWGGFTMGPKFAFNGEVDYLKVKVNDVDGQIFGYNLMLTFRVIPNFDIAAGFTGFHCIIDAEKNDLNGYFKWNYDGPSLRFSYSFGKEKWQ